ncbi:MAG: thioredoxin [Blastochloris viridis]|uniref:Thioredoxin n=1 Tax=Blastochloris viridis TaxID=1079 RepID=A0A6N4R5Z6_BLAVI|nr:MAG: thioredoxin [Blastochloris viridis]
MVASVNDSEFKSSVLDSDGVTVVDFWAEWCGPCKALSPLLEQAASEVEGVTVVKMNVDENTDTPVQYGIRGIPTLIAFKGGQPVASLVGLRDKAELVSWMESQK